MAEEIGGYEKNSTKSWFNGREDEINQMQYEITSWMERRNRALERRRARVGGNRGRNSAGKRRGESSKEQTEEESALVGAADRGVQGSEHHGKYRGNVRLTEKACKERTQGNRRNNNNKWLSEWFKAHFEKLTGERFENLREEIKISVMRWRTSARNH